MDSAGSQLVHTPATVPRMRIRIIALVAWLIIGAGAWGQVTPVQEASCGAQQAGKPAKFEVSFPQSAHAAPITGRVFVVLARRPDPDPREQIGSWTQRTPYFGEDVSELKPGEAAMVAGGALGFPFKSLCGVAAGDYYVEAVLNVYT